MQAFRKVCLGAAVVGLVLLVAGLATQATDWWQAGAVILAVGIAIGLGANASLAGFQFTAWIIAGVTIAMLYPASLQRIGPIDLQDPWLKLFIIQAVMFGMGTQMGLKDFANVAKMPWGVFVGIFCQFTIMPLVGFSLTKLFNFPDEIAAGLVLIGSCSSGLASNVMVYMAGGNLALSITLTSVATLMAPLMTPLWMKFLAGALVEVHFFAMMATIIKIVIMPIGAALLHDYLKHASPGGRRAVFSIAAVGALWLTFLVLGGWTYVTGHVYGAALTWIGLEGFLLATFVVGVVYHGLTLGLPWLDRKMPLAAMFGIVYFTSIATANGRDELLQVGILLLLAAIIHNTAGYCLGYWLSRALRMDRVSARTVAFEVGLQNGAMAVGLADAMGKLGTTGLAGVIFSPWMNSSGSLLANYWKRRPVEETTVAEAVPAG